MKDIKKDDSIVLICAPKNSGNTIGIEAFCVKCDCSIWISDSTINSVKDQYQDVDLLVNKPKAFCIKCGMAHLKTVEHKEVIPLSKTQIEEITLARNK